SASNCGCTTSGHTLGRAVAADVRDRVLVGFARRAYEEGVKRIRWLCLVMISVWPCSRVPVRPIVGGAPVARAAVALDEETVAGAEHFWNGYPADGVSGVNAVIEIPCGTTGKFEVAEADGWLHWQHDREN